jgi:hypothetical protein
MLWLPLLIAVAVVVALLASSGFRVRGGRPVASTGLMTAARVVGLVLALVLAYVAWHR